MEKAKRVRHLSNPQFKPNPFARSMRDERGEGADEGTLVGGADAPTVHDLPDREPATPSFGGTAGTADHYRTDDGDVHDERTGYQGWERRFGAPGYPPAVENQFEASSGPPQSTVERDGEALGAVPTGVLHLDLRVRELVETRLARSAKFDASGITVTVASGVVTLTGVVANLAQRSELVELAEQITGVREVKSAIEIAAPHQGD